MASDEIFTADFVERPYWWTDGDPALTRPSQDPIPTSVDVLVIGGGVTGLSCALSLASQGVSVAVIEKNAIGWGASSRNAGGVSGGVNLAQGRSSLGREVGNAQLKAMRDEAVASYDFLRELITHEEIDCDFNHNGRFLAAHSPDAFKSLERRAHDLNADGEVEAEILPKNRVGEELGSSAFFGGMVVKRSGVVQPAKYVQGLARAASKRGAGLFSGTEVSGFSKRPDGSFLVETSKGAITAREIVVATNGYTSNVTAWHRRRLIPIGSFIIATEELDPDLVSSCLVKGRFYADTRRLLHYFRPSPDGRRVVFGGRADFVSRERAACAILFRHMVEMFPQLRDVKISYGWTGNVAFSFDGLPHVGVDGGVHYALGCNGSGVTILSYLGHRIATRITGQESSPTAFANIPFATKPLYSGYPWFLPVIGTWFKLRDSLDLARARRAK